MRIKSINLALVHHVISEEQNAEFRKVLRQEAKVREFGMAYGLTGVEFEKALQAKAPRT